MATAIVVSSLAYTEEVAPEDHSAAARAFLCDVKASYARGVDHRIITKELVEAALARYRAKAE